MPHPYLAGAERPRVLAHRGFVSPAAAGRGVAENSLASVSAAVDAGAAYVETDCHLTRDGVVVLFHDADLARVLGDRRAIAQVEHAELSDLMASRGGLLTLERALETFPETRFNIDVKAGAAAAPAGRIVAPHAGRVLLTGFSDGIRRRALHAAESAAGRGSLLPATSPGRNALARVLLALASRSRARTERSLAGFDALQIPERRGAIRVLTSRLIEEAHRAGVEVHVWTVNDPVRMGQLVALGVDGVITDRADLALESLRRPSHG